MRYVVPLLIVVFLLSARGFAAPAPQPRLRLFVDAADIERAHERCETLDWARERKQQVLKIADEWVNRSDDWIRQVMPAPGSTFAYGVAGCPKCGGSWRRFGMDVATFDKPLELNCPHCGTRFDLKEPKGEFADTGDGVNVNGRPFWLRGVWNAFVTNSLWSAFDAESAAIVNLAEAYALSGDDRYATKAIVIMDALATLAPATIGPRDFENDPTKEAGRLHHLTSIVHRSQVHFARAMDFLGEHPDFEQQSPTNPDRTIWDNVRHGIFEEYLFGEYDTRGGKLRDLHNHEADSVRSLLLVGILYGNADYVRWGAAGVGAFLDNTIDRDGLYYETSLGYTDFARSVFIDMAELLARYDPANYPAGTMPAREELPFGGNYFDHPSLARLTLDQPSRVSMLGRAPTFGNSHFDSTVWKKPGREFKRFEHQQAQRFLLYASDDKIRARAADVVAAMAPLSDQNPRGGWWALFRALGEGDLNSLASSRTPSTHVPEETDSDFFGNTGLIYLRSGTGEHRRGAILRAGMSMPHAHDDQLGLLLFANGRALSGDVGYGIFGNHVHLGWAARAIAHNTVVINQDESQAGTGKIFRIGPGGTIRRFGQAPGVSWAEASLQATYPPEDGIRQHSRTLLQIDLSPESAYWVDLFNVEGGRVRDYSLHANPVDVGGSFEIEGIDPQPVEGAWTLAGLDPKWRDAAFNAPGKSWGERLGVDGMLKQIGGEGDAEPQRGWYPPPGNGYGFLHDVKLAETQQPWSATWRWRDKQERHGLRVTMVPQGRQKVITALGPNLNGTRQMNFVIARQGEPGGETAGGSYFASVHEPFAGDEPHVRSVEPITQDGRTAGLLIRSAGGREDFILDATGGAVVGDETRPSLHGGLGVVRVREGKLEAVILTGAASFEWGGVRLAFERDKIEARVAEVDDDAGTFRTDPPLPASAVGSTIFVNNEKYTHGSAYRVGAISAEDFIMPLKSGLTLGRGAVDSFDGGRLASTAPLVFGYEYGLSTRFLDGKRITAGGQTGRVVAAEDFAVIRTEGISPQPGERFIVHDVQVGDTVRLDSTASLIRQDDGSWELRSNAAVAVTLPGG